MSTFQVNHLCAGYGNRQIINDFSLTLSTGLFVGLLGENGCGKTTLLKSMCGILPHTGTCSFDGTILENLSDRERSCRIGYIPQQSGISIELSVLDVVLMGFNPKLRFFEAPDASMRQEALTALDFVGLSSAADTDFQTLSQGQKQLCMFARMLVSDGRLLFLDEPEGALDFRHRYLLADLLHKKVAEDRLALVSMHDPQLAINSCDRLVLLKDGKLLSVLSPSSDSLTDMERDLAVIYGPLSLSECTNRAGKRQLVLLHEAE